MKKTTERDYSKIIVAILALFVGSTAEYFYPSHNVMASLPSRQVRAPLPTFRYVIVHNYPLHNGRIVTVLLNSKSYSEDNLKELFALVSKRFREPNEVHVAVLTSLEQLPTPEEQDFETANPAAVFPYENEVEKYPGASYTRAHGKEFFRYSLGDGTPDKLVTVK